MTIGVEELFTKRGKSGNLAVFDICEFCVNDGQGLGFGGDVGMLGLELGKEGLEVGNCAFYRLDSMVVLSADLIAVDCDIACVEVADGADVESGLIFRGGGHGKSAGGGSCCSYSAIASSITSVGTSARSDLE